MLVSAFCSFAADKVEIRIVDKDGKSMLKQ